MRTLSILQELQDVSTKMQERKYSVYRIEDADSVTKFAIPVENVVEFDRALNDPERKELKYLIDKYDGFLVTK